MNEFTCICCRFDQVPPSLEDRYPKATGWEIEGDHWSVHGSHWSESKINLDVNGDQWIKPCDLLDATSMPLGTTHLTRLTPVRYTHQPHNDADDHDHDNEYCTRPEASDLVQMNTERGEPHFYYAKIDTGSGAPGSGSKLVLIGPAVFK